MSRCLPGHVHAILLGICLLTGLVLPVWTQTPLDIPRLQQANTLFSQGKYADAMPLWADLLKECPDGLEGIRNRYYLGVCYSRTGRKAEATGIFEELRATAIQPPLPYQGEALVELFSQYLADGDETRANAVRRQCYTDWPRSEYVQRICEADFALRSPEMREVSCRALEEAEQLGVLHEEGLPLLYELYYQTTAAAFNADPRRNGAQARVILEKAIVWQQRFLEHLTQRDLLSRYSVTILATNLHIANLTVRHIPRDHPESQPTVEKARALFAMTVVRDDVPLSGYDLQSLKGCMSADASPEIWLPMYARLLRKIPVKDAKRTEEYLEYGRITHRYALTTELCGRPAAPLEQEAETTYRMILTDFPDDPAALQAMLGLFSLYRYTGREKELAQLIEYATRSKSWPLKKWLAEYWYAAGTEEGYMQALDVLKQLIAQQQTDPMRKVWLYRLGRCYEYIGKPAEAITAYQQVMDGYPRTSCALASQWAITHLKGAQK